MRNTSLSFVLLLSLFFWSCQKDISKEPQYSEKAKAVAGSDRGHLVQTKTFSSDVAQDWLDMELRLQWANTYALNGNRFFAYLGVALYESVVPGMPAYLSLEGQLNGMPDMPETEPGTAYHWPAAANTALAYLLRNFYTRPESAGLRPSIDSLEAALNTRYRAEVDAATFARSVAFGAEIGRRILEWARADGAANAACAYTPSTEVGKWNTTNPLTGLTFAPSLPCWGQNRMFVAGSTEGIYSPLPPPYSEDPNSAYYAMVKEVYDASRPLTPEEMTQARYFNDNPGYPGGSHNLAVFRQIMEAEQFTLDQYALAWAKLGLALADAQIALWKQKYELLVDRPTRYIREVIGDYIPDAKSWTPYLAMPPYPEYPGGQSQTVGTFAAIMESILGTDYAFTLRTYEVTGYAPRSYDSFADLVNDVNWARVYSGYHYVYTVEESAKQGARIAANILELVDFHKGEGHP
jgi:hypothetical protein